MPYRVKRMRIYRRDPVKIGDLITRVGITNWGCTVYSIEGIGKWIAPANCWFETDSKDNVRFVTRPVGFSTRSSKPFHTLEELLRTVNARLNVLFKLNGYILMGSLPDWIRRDDLSKQKVSADQWRVQLPRAFDGLSFMVSSEAQLIEEKEIIINQLVEHCSVDVKESYPHVRQHH